MDDLIRRGDVALAKSSTDSGIVGIAWNAAVDAVVKYAPAVDAVDRVRCRECKFFDAGQNDAEAWEWCTIWERDSESECFCKYGQRREDGDGDG